MMSIFKQFKGKFYLLLAAVLMIAFSTTAWGATPSTLKRNDWRALQRFYNGIEVLGGDLLVNGQLIKGSQFSDVYYVDSTGGANTLGNDYGKSWEKPFATIEYAINQCTAGQGDIIFVNPSHSETLSAADGIDADIAGIYIIGLGEGDDRATITYDNTAGEFVIGAANVYVSGFRFSAGISGVTMGISIEAGGDYATIDNCDFVSGTSVYEFTDGIDLASGADFVTVQNCYYNSVITTGEAHFIEAGNGVNNALHIKNCEIHGEFSTAAIWSDTVDTFVLIEDCVITNLTSGQHAVEFSGAATGTIRNCILRTDTQTACLDPGSMTVVNVLWDDEDTAETAVVDAFTVPGKDYVSQVSTTSGITDEDLFDVAGGPILIKLFFGIVTTNIENQACTLEILLDADTGFADHDFSTAVDLDNDAAGTRIAFTAVAEAVLTEEAGADGGASILMDGWFCGEGMIEQATSATNTGAITWYMLWTPLSPGVTVTAQ